MWYTRHQYNPTYDIPLALDVTKMCTKPVTRSDLSCCHKPTNLRYTDGHLDHNLFSMVWIVSNYLSTVVSGYPTLNDPI